MNAIRLLLPTVLYMLSLTTLMAMVLAPDSSSGLQIEIGPATVIGIEAPATVAEEGDFPLVLREIG